MKCEINHGVEDPKIMHMMQMLILFKEKIEIQWNGIMHMMQKFTTIEHRNQMKQNNAYDAKFKIYSNNKDHMKYQRSTTMIQ